MIFNWIILFLVFLLVYKIFQDVFGKKNNNTSTNFKKESPYSELHGHRCFVDNLTHYEYQLVKTLSKHLDPKQYYLFNNVIVPSSNSITTQVDHIIVSKYGIFVIENKDFSGWIFGNKNNKIWTQIIKRRRFHFQNPLFQNFAHVSALKEQMPFLKKVFFSIVVFSEQSIFKTSIPENVMYGSELLNYLESKKDIILSELELLMAIGKLSVLCQTAQISNNEHVKNINLIHTESESLKSFS